MRRFLLLFGSLLLLTGLQPGRAQQPARGPWENPVLISESADGLRFTNPRVWLQGAGVPHVTRDSRGRLIATFQWFPTDRRQDWDRIAVRFSTDGGKTWTDPQAIRVTDYPARYHRPCDPTLVVLPDGRYRLYFTADTPEGRGPGTYSAISSDAVNFRFEPGARFRVDGEKVLDCAVARLGETWHYFAPVQDAGRGYHATSRDGLNFTRQPDVQLGSRNWLGCALTTGGRLRFFGTGPGGWSATSTDGSRWQLDPGTSYFGADPGAAPAGENRWVLLSTGPPSGSSARRGSSSAMTGNGRYLYILRGEELLQLDAETLEVLRRQPLPR